MQRRPKMGDYNLLAKTNALRKLAKIKEDKLLKVDEELKAKLDKIANSQTYWLLIVCAVALIYH